MKILKSLVIITLLAFAVSEKRFKSHTQSRTAALSGLLAQLKAKAAGDGDTIAVDDITNKQFDALVTIGNAATNSTGYLYTIDIDTAAQSATQKGVLLGGCSLNSNVLVNDQITNGGIKIDVTYLPYRNLQEFSYFSAGGLYNYLKTSDGTNLIYIYLNLGQTDGANLAEKLNNRRKQRQVVLADAVKQMASNAQTYCDNKNLADKTTVTASDLTTQITTLQNEIVASKTQAATLDAKETTAANDKATQEATLVTLTQKLTTLNQSYTDISNQIQSIKDTNTDLQNGKANATQLKTDSETKRDNSLAGFVAVQALIVAQCAACSDSLNSAVTSLKSGDLATAQKYIAGLF